jgi:hypothetical protein
MVAHAKGGVLLLALFIWIASLATLPWQASSAAPSLGASPQGRAYSHVN